MRITWNYRRAAAAVILGLAAAGACLSPAVAQTDQPSEQPQVNQFGPRVKTGAATKAPAMKEIATHGAWKVQCEEGGADGGDAQKPQCGMMQSAKSDKNPKVGLTLVIIKATQGDKSVTMMRLVAPIGVFLPTGVALEVDGAAVGRVPFTRCMPQACVAFAEASADTLSKMKKGSAANFIIYEAPGLGMPVKISLDGFSAALGELDKL